ncbi:hypothetical protein [Paracoccus sp. S1E-3]|uniref:hypothetical protein n=1 Tax=Paracoccus sp. S1E-3 TaxID=2756130 RepID=UPI0015EEE168|nr:hypothetical protein [Paracoccus sp. S1E-3]MBA4490616.1 hypothetical protein [Paracoccus sp. S1E-3]
MLSDKDIDSIWVIPPDRALDILPALLTAASPAEIWTATLRYRTEYADGIEARLDREMDEMGPAPDDIDMNDRLRRDMRATAMDRAVESWDGLTGLAGRRETPDDERQPLCFGMPLIETWPVPDLALEPDQVYAETSRMQDEIGALISAHRGIGPRRITLPDAALSFYDDEDWTDTQALLAEIAKLTAYWPPAKGLPGLALAQSQEHAAEPIAILIYAHTDTGHEALSRIVAGAGGRID